MKNIRKDLGLHNTRALNQRINRYFNKRKLSKFFIKRGQKLLNKRERFKLVNKTRELAFGLNNAVFEIDIAFHKRGEPDLFNRKYIVRVYPNKKNTYKAKNETKRYEEISDLNFPKARLYYYETDLKVIGNQFLILDKLSGQPVLKTIKNFSKNQTKAFLSNLAKILGTLHSKRSKKYDSYYINKKNTKKMAFADYIMMEIKNTINNFKKMELDKELQIDTRYLFKWCKGHKPLLRIEEFSLVHGDIRPSNIIVQGDQISGLIDWEMSCYSDPAQDIGWTLFFFKLYDNLSKLRGFFFTKYWEVCDEYNVEARVAFFEVLAALKIYIYMRYIEANQPEKFQNNIDFFKRIKRVVPKYIDRISHRD